MTLTTTPIPTKTDAELLALLSAMTVPQQNLIRQGYDAYVNRRLCFWAKWPASKTDAQSLIPEYLTEIAPGQFQLTDLGVNLYRAWLHQPLARPDADKQPQSYHGTRHSRNRNVRDLWEQKVPSSGLPAATPESSKDSELLTKPAEGVETPATATRANEPAVKPAERAENFQPLALPTPPPPPTPPTPPAVIQLDLSAFMQPLLAEIAALKAQLAATATPAPQPRPVARRKSRAAMPMTVLV
ncbi:MAG: hypothetical protein DPW16_18020 [Chloroflexi bacterium]|nr:hypothetical protein [Chloroflexota bacterium]